VTPEESKDFFHLKGDWLLKMESRYTTTYQYITIDDLFAAFKSRLLEETTAIPREDKG
jgi:hypothetical protein